MIVLHPQSQSQSQSQAQERFHVRTARVGDAGVVARVRAAARSVPGADPAFLLAVADRESRLDPTARNKRSSASGLYQFTDRTWVSAVAAYGALHGQPDAARSASEGGDLSKVMALRENVEFSTVMAAETMMGERTALEAILGRKPSATDMYITHAMGSGGGLSFLRRMSSGASPLYEGIRNDIETKRNIYLALLSSY